MPQENFQINNEPEQMGLDMRTDAQALADARTKKIDELSTREMRLLAVANSIEDHEDEKGTIGGQKIH